jgi:hypothetical protein
MSSASAALGTQSCELREEYNTWLEARQEHPISVRAFAQLAEERGFQRKRVKEGSRYLELRLTSQGTV